MSTLDRILALLLKIVSIVATVQGFVSAGNDNYPKAAYHMAFACLAAFLAWRSWEENDKEEPRAR